MKLPKVSVAILNWNGRSWLEKFLPSVKKSTYPFLEIIIVDNASTDDSVDFIRENYPEFKLLIWDKNYGFAEGYNRVLPHIKSPYLVLLNSDVEVSPDWVQPLVKAMEADAKLVSVQPKVLAHHDKNIFEHAGAAGGFMDYLSYPFCRGRIFESVEKDLGQYDSYMEVFWATGACCMLRTDLVRELGLFQAEFFAHMEEIDFCWRAKNFGYKVACEPQSVVYHVGGGALPVSSPFKTYLNFRNSLFTMLLNLPTSQIFPRIFMRMVLDGVWGIRQLLSGDVRNIWAVIRAHVSFYGALSFWIKRRKEIYKDHPPKILKIGRHDKSLVWQHFVRGKDKFSEL